ncbi:MAG: hypothetical protein WAR79_06355 [Melioribacteraceae bacterium]
MKKNLKIFLIILTPIIIILFGIFIFIIFQIPEIDDVYDNVKVRSSNNSDSLYIKRHSRGLNYSEVCISNSKRKEVNVAEDFSLKTVAEIFYKINNDTLFIYSSVTFKKPLKFENKIVVKNEVLSNPEMMKMYEEFAILDIKKF